MSEFAELCARWNLRDAEHQILSYGVEANRTWWPADAVARAGADLDALKTEVRSLAREIRERAPSLAVELERAGEPSTTILTIANLARGLEGAADMRKRWLEMKTELDRVVLRLGMVGQNPNEPTAAAAPTPDRRTLSWSKAAYFLQYPEKQAPHGDALRAAARRAAEGHGAALDYARLWTNAVRTGKGRSPRIVDVEEIERTHFGAASPKHTDSRPRASRPRRVHRPRRGGMPSAN